MGYGTCGTPARVASSTNSGSGGLRYTQRFADAGAVASVGSTGDCYDNALAEAFNSLLKAERPRDGPGHSDRVRLR